MQDQRHSFAVLAYGESPFLCACLDSLLEQSVPSKILVCTGTPNDFIQSVCSRYRLPLFINPAHESIAGDWNFAAAQVKTPYYTLAHQDDLYYPDYTKALLPRMPESLIGFTDYEELVGDAARRCTPMLTIKRLLLLPCYFSPSLRGTRAKKSILRFGSAICCPSVMYNRIRLEPFAFDGGFRVDLDWDAWLRMCGMEGAFAYDRHVLMAHRIHENSETTRQIASDGRSREDGLMMSRLWPRGLAAVLSKLYAHSTDSNRVRRR